MYRMERLAAMTRLRGIQAQREPYEVFDIMDARRMVELWPEMKLVGVDGCTENVFRNVIDVFKTRGVSIVGTKAYLKI